MGPEMKDKKADLEAGMYRYKLSAAAMIHEGRDRVDINDFVGIAQSRRNEDGSFTLNLAGAPPRGRRNEVNVCGTLVEAIAERDGRAPQLLAGSDERGEDGILRFPDGSQLVLQIVTVPCDAEHGRLVSKGEAQLTFTAADGAQMILSAIALKKHIPRDHRRKTLLALDARHAAILRHDDIMASLQARRGELRDAGFSEIWLVGATRANSRQLA
jgi:hypothetical protein